VTERVSHVPPFKPQWAEIGMRSVISNGIVRDEIGAVNPGCVYHFNTGVSVSKLHHRQPVWERWKYLKFAGAATLG